MLLLAHRGYHASLPENTMAAFAAATRLGVDGIETDVRLSADGEAVIMHDRVTPRKRAVAELTRCEIEHDVGHPVPLLAEVLDAFSGVLWNVEIKTPDALPAVLAVLRRYGGKCRLFITSFRHDVAAEIARQIAVDCGLLLAHRPLDVAAIIAGCAAWPRIKAIVWDYSIVDAAALQAVEHGGWQNYVYGAITPAEHERCAQLGLAGLITDYPLQVLARQAPAGEA
ncbi:MAG: glycerophosphodiester phosphodiesterase [Pseudomonadota bacterium]